MMSLSDPDLAALSPGDLPEYVFAEGPFGVDGVSEEGFEEGEVVCNLDSVVAALTEELSGGAEAGLIEVLNTLLHTQRRRPVTVVLFVRVYRCMKEMAEKWVNRFSAASVWQRVADQVGDQIPNFLEDVDAIYLSVYGSVKPKMVGDGSVDQMWDAVSGD